jgi:hypothetical protein
MARGMKGFETNCRTSPEFNQIDYFLFTLCQKTFSNAITGVLGRTVSEQVNPPLM